MKVKLSDLTCFQPNNFLTAGDVADVSDKRDVSPIILVQQN